MTNVSPYEEQNPTGTDTWARIYVPNTPIGYLRLGANPADPVELPFQAFIQPYDASTNPNSWFLNSNITPVTAQLTGSFAYTDQHRVVATGASAYRYVFVDDHHYVLGTRTTAVGTNITASTEGNPDTTPLDVYRPVNESASAFQLPNFIEGQTGTTTATGSAVPPISYADEEEIRGSRKLKVFDLLVNDVRGDRADYVRGDHYHFVRGSHRLVIDGSDDETETGDKTTTILGNRTETIGAPGEDNKKTKTVTVYGTSNTTVHGNSNSTVHGDRDVVVYGTRSSTVHGYRQSVRYGGMVSVNIGGRFSFDLALRILISTGFYFRVIQFRFSIFGFKGDWVRVKFDGGKVKIGDYKTYVNNAAAALAFKKTAFTYGTFGLSNIVTSIKNRSLDVHF